MKGKRLAAAGKWMALAQSRCHPGAQALLEHRGRGKHQTRKASFRALKRHLPDAVCRALKRHLSDAVCRALKRHLSDAVYRALNADACASTTPASTQLDIGASWSGGGLDRGW